MPSPCVAKVPVRESLTLTYLGNAGWRIAHGHTVIIVDPYVTQFREQRLADPNTDDDRDEVLVPDETLIAEHIPRADFVLVTHSSSRLMRALGDPAVVLPTHWDSYANATVEQSRNEVEQFAAQIRAAASPHTRVIIPEYFKPVTLP